MLSPGIEICRFFEIFSCFLLSVVVGKFFFKSSGNLLHVGTKGNFFHDFFDKNDEFSTPGGERHKTSV